MTRLMMRPESWATSPNRRQAWDGAHQLAPECSSWPEADQRLMSPTACEQIVGSQPHFCQIAVSRSTENPLYSLVHGSARRISP